MKMDLDMQTSLEALAGLNDHVEDSLAERGVDAGRIVHVRLIIEELACNAISHGGCVASGRPLKLRLAVDESALVLELRECGQAFDPGAARSPALDDGIESRPIGGLGLFLVQQLADALDYRREGDANIVRVTLLNPFSPTPETLP